MAYSLAAAQRLGGGGAPAYAVVLTGERRFFGNVLIKKGVVPPTN